MAVSMKQKPRLMTNLFSWYGEDGNKLRECFVGDDSPTSQPYVVRLEEVDERGGWIPISLVIFAQSEEDAKARVVNGLVQIKKDLEESLQRIADRVRQSILRSEFGRKDEESIQDAIEQAQTFVRMRLENVEKMLLMAVYERPTRPYRTVRFEAELMDKRLAAKAPWAVNDQILTV